MWCFIVWKYNIEHLVYLLPHSEYVEHPPEGVSLCTCSCQCRRSPCSVCMSGYVCVCMCLYVCVFMCECMLCTYVESSCEPVYFVALYRQLASLILGTLALLPNISFTRLSGAFHYTTIGHHHTNIITVLHYTILHYTTLHHTSPNHLPYSTIDKWLLTLY